METKYISQIKPEYNILNLAENSLGFKHSQESKQKMKENWEKNTDRKLKLRDQNKNKKFDIESREIYRTAAIQRYKNQPNLRHKISLALRKTVIIYNDSGIIIGEYLGIRNMAREFKCCHKTINNCIKTGKKFRGYMTLKLKTRE